MLISTKNRKIYAKCENSDVFCESAKQLMFRIFVSEKKIINYEL